MKIFLTGRNLDDILPVIEKAGLCLTDSAQEADVIVTYGGDGALLGAETRYPGQLKMPLRDAATAPLCPKHTCEKMVSALLDGSISRTVLPKLSGTAKGSELIALNDVFIHNRNFVSAMRYKVWIDGELYGREIVGDGVGLSTVQGSTAYYRSITHSIFRTGIGLAFSNSTELVNHLVLPESSVIRVRILRGPCEMVADNSPERILLEAGDEAELRLSSETTQILGLECFMCQDCRTLRHTLRNSRQNG